MTVLSPPRSRRGGARLLVLMGVLLAVVLAAAYQGILPQWVPFRGVFSGAVPAAPAVEYPVFGSDELVQYLGASMVAQVESIDVTHWANADGVGQDGVLDAAAVAAIQNPYAFVDGWTYKTTLSGVMLVPDYTYRPGEAERRRAETLAAVSVGLEAAGVTAGQAESDKVREIHDYVASVASYDHAASDAITAGAADTPQVDQSQEAYGILVAGSAVCNGYAKAFQAMASAAGLQSVVVTGEAWSGFTTGSHAWNLVFVDGAWRVVDVTWDDADGGAVLHDYLLLAQDDLALTTRTADEDWVVDGQAGALVP